MGQCKKCLQEKIMEYSHLGTNGAKLYKDDKGRFWKGKVCPDCQNEIRRSSRNTVKTLKDSLESTNELSFIADMKVGNNAT